MRIDPVTNRYAGALFSLAKKRGVLERVEQDIARIDGELRSPAVAGFLFDARIGLEERRTKLGALLAGLDPLTQNLVNLLFDRRREAVLRHLGTAFHQRSLAERGEVEGVVESARALDRVELDRLAGSLGPRLGKTVSLENRIVPDLVGGVRVTVENRMIDFSVQGRLEGLRRVLQEAPLPSAQA